MTTQNPNQPAQAPASVPQQAPQAPQQPAQPAPAPAGVPVAPQPAQAPAGAPQPAQPQPGVVSAASPGGEAEQVHATQDSPVASDSATGGEAEVDQEEPVNLQASGVMQTLDDDLPAKQQTGQGEEGGAERIEQEILAGNPYPQPYSKKLGSDPADETGNVPQTPGSSSDIVTSGAAGVYGEESSNKNG